MKTIEELRSELRSRLLEEKAALSPYLLQKFKASDWHGVADAAMDLRDIDAQLDILNQFNNALNSNSITTIHPGAIR